MYISSRSEGVRFWQNKYPSAIYDLLAGCRRQKIHPFTPCDYLGVEENEKFDIDKYSSKFLFLSGSEEIVCSFKMKCHH